MTIEVLLAKSPGKGLGGRPLGGIVAVIGYGLGVIGAGLGIGLAAYGAATGMARQPEVQGRLFTVFILAAAFVEALGLIGFVATLIA